MVMSQAHMFPDWRRVWLEEWREEKYWITPSTYFFFENILYVKMVETYFKHLFDRCTLYVHLWSVCWLPCSSSAKTTPSHPAEPGVSLAVFFFIFAFLLITLSCPTPSHTLSNSPTLASLSTSFLRSVTPHLRHYFLSIHSPNLSHYFKPCQFFHFSPLDACWESRASIKHIHCYHLGDTEGSCACLSNIPLIGRRDLVSTHTHTLKL